jgi:hypothetical protein
LLENIKLSQYEYKEGQTCWKERRSSRLNQTPHTGNTRNLSTYLW